MSLTILLCLLCTLLSLSQSCDPQIVQNKYTECIIQNQQNGDCDFNGWCSACLNQLEDIGECTCTRALDGYKPHCIEPCAAFSTCVSLQVFGKRSEEECNHLKTAYEDCLYN